MEESNNISNKTEEKLVIVNDEDDDKQRTYEITQTDHLNAKLLSIVKNIPPQFMQNDDDDDSDDYESDKDE